MKTPVRTKIAVIGCAISASLAIGFVTIELGLRTLGIGHPRFMQIDPIRGSALLAGAEGWQKYEGKAYIRINSQGLRDREHGLGRAPGTFRIAVLGDSFAEALQVDRANAFWSVIESELAGCKALAGRRIEAINFGISGHGTAQQLLTLRHHAWKYDPDLVLLALYTGNDIRNNHRVLEGSPYRPYFVLRNQRLVLDDSFSRLPDFAADAVSWNRTRSRWINRSRTLQVAAQAYKQVRAMSAGAGQAEVAQPASTTHSIEPGVHDAILRPPTNKYWRDAWRVTEALLLQMSREVGERGKDFMVGTLTIGIQVNPNKSERTRFMQRLGIASLDYPDRRIAAFTASHGIQTVTLLDDFRRHAEARGVFLHGFNDLTTFA